MGSDGYLLFTQQYLVRMKDGFWKAVLKELEAGNNILLMYVIYSEGSSPGRQGFKMFVSGSGKLEGSIGGGIMEYKLVEWCREELLSKEFTPFVKEQIHRDGIPANKSGMICSGRQRIAFYKLDLSHIELVRRILLAIGAFNPGIILLDNEGIQFIENRNLQDRFQLKETADSWELIEDPINLPTLHIVGGGHVSLALSRLAAYVGFSVIVYDDRDKLNTTEDNESAKIIHLPDYGDVASYLNAGTADFIVLMSFGYRTDKLVLEKLLRINCQYLGMMGSVEKVKRLFSELLEEGISPEHIERVHAPVGLAINSKTPEEIAISTLAEIIKTKNKSQVYKHG